MTDEDLTTLIRASRPAAHRPGRGCPDEGRLAAYAEGKLAGDVRSGIEEHLAGCTFCLGQVGFLVRGRDLPPAPALPGPLLAKARGRRSWLAGWLRPATVAAAAATVILALVSYPPTGRSRGPSAGTAAVAPGGASSPVGLPGGPDAPGPRDLRNGGLPADVPRLLSPAEGTSVPRGALELRWQETADALFYSVQLVDPRGDVVWEGRADAARLAVPAVAPLVPGERYFVWVVAHLRSGATTRSPAVGFRLAPD